MPELLEIYHMERSLDETLLTLATVVICRPKMVSY